MQKTFLFSIARHFFARFTKRMSAEKILADFGLSFEKQRPDLGKDFDVKDALRRFFSEVTLHGYTSPCVAYGVACWKMQRENEIVRVATTHFDLGEKPRFEDLMKGIALFEFEESEQERAAKEAVAYLEKTHDKPDFAWLFEVNAPEVNNIDHHSIEFLLIKKTM